VNEQESWPFSLVAFLPPVRLNDKSVHLLPFRSFKVKVLRRTQRFAHQRFLGEPGNLFRCAFPLEFALSLSKVCFKLVETTNNEYVIWSLERGAGEYEPVIGQYLEARDGAIVRKWLGCETLGWKRWLRCRLVWGIRDRDNEELVACMVTSSQIKKRRFLGELRDI
jgi:hypothetical protein